MENEAEVAARSSGVQGAVPDFATTQRDKEATIAPTRVTVDWQTPSADATAADNSYKANYNAYVEACALE